MAFNVSSPPRGVETRKVAVQRWMPPCADSRLNFWRATPSFARGAFGANLLLLGAGVALTIYQLAGYFAS